MSSPDDKTVIVQRQPAPDGQQGGADAADPDRTVVTRPPTPAGNAQHALPAGTRLGEFEIVSVIGEGGFGIVYLAHDTQLGRNVAIKEYIPAALASRVGTAEVSVRSQRHEDTFRAGLKSFINEARLLARFDHHSLVKVYRFWEANGTAYMVMPYYEGMTLRDGLRLMPTPPDEAWLFGLLTPLIDALAVLHAAQCYHRDIAPDNIMLLKGGGRPLLLDFGAARRVIGDMTQALTVILKPGYAPIEQYAEVAALKQGPWTDVYALAAVVYFAILGKTPPPSVGRMMSDTYVPLADAAAGRYSERFLRAIDHALAVRPESRPQSVHVLARELGISMPDPADIASGSDASGVGDLRGSSSSATLRNPSSASGESMGESNSTQRRPQPPAAAVLDAKNRNRTGLIAGAAVCVVALAAVGAWMATRSSAPVATAPRSSPPSSLTSAEPSSHSARMAAVAPSVSPSPPPVSQAAATPPPDTLAAFTPGSEFERIATLADPAIHVTGTLRSTTARIGKDHLQFKVSSNRAGYVYVFMVDPSNQYLMLFPNGLDRNNTITAGQTLSLPRASWPMLAGEPPGPNRFLVLVSPEPRDFSVAGLKPGAVFAAFPEDAQREAATRRTSQYSPFAGKPLCAAGASDCPNEFGVTSFTIDAVKPAG
ncbi:serine/threonine-protein kinase [Paraburkholderia kirstenboschensis]|uniref:Serine/threonine-protein kinase n=1 Tax=Paraburkholderia kirstenboschensis TaxID=1245436 RepID=A0ABZ0ESH8_9BURK|nr:serine/threonine-protein kinase [Paraburkholderia kirstenboschensis]WOD20096.1 serine/threonine-protein kinase [Paraburkholderia kirstenboschensis]